MKFALAGDVAPPCYWCVRDDGTHVPQCPGLAVPARPSFTHRGAVNTCSTNAIDPEAVGPCWLRKLAKRRWCGTCLMESSDLG